jgi:hypothetical protein
MYYFSEDKYNKNKPNYQIKLQEKKIKKSGLKICIYKKKMLYLLMLKEMTTTLNNLLLWQRFLIIFLIALK